jgi:hypothetical protein
LFFETAFAETLVDLLTPAPGGLGALEELLIADRR